MAVNRAAAAARRSELEGHLRHQAAVWPLLLRRPAGLSAICSCSVDKVQWGWIQQRTKTHINPHLYAWLCAWATLWVSKEVISLTYLMFLIALQFHFTLLTSLQKTWFWNNSLIISPWANSGCGLRLTYCVLGPWCLEWMWTNESWYKKLKCTHFFSKYLYINIGR